MAARGVAGDGEAGATGAGTEAPNITVDLAAVGLAAAGADEETAPNIMVPRPAPGPLAPAAGEAAGVAGAGCTAPNITVARGEGAGADAGWAGAPAPTAPNIWVPAARAGAGAVTGGCEGVIGPPPNIIVARGVGAGDGEGAGVGGSGESPRAPNICVAPARGAEGGGLTATAPNIRVAPAFGALGAGGTSTAPNILVFAGSPCSSTGVPNIMVEPLCRTGASSTFESAVGRWAVNTRPHLVHCTGAP